MYQKLILYTIIVKFTNRINRNPWDWSFWIHAFFMSQLRWEPLLGTGKLKWIWERQYRMRLTLWVRSQPEFNPSGPHCPEITPDRQITVIKTRCGSLRVFWHAHTHTHTHTCVHLC